MLTDCIVLFNFTIPFYISRVWADRIQGCLIKWRIMSPRAHRKKHIRRRYVHVEDPHTGQLVNTGEARRFICYPFPMNIVTAPLIADLFLLAIGAIGKEEVKQGTVGSDNIKPYDIMIFFLTLAYIAISIDASGLIRYLAFRVLKWGGKAGHRLFFYLYAFFFALGSFIGNDPIILSGTAFLAYMTRVSSNIVHPRAWIFTQFSIANIASAILVSSNPTNLVLAGAFEIKFIHYTANMIVPVIITAIVLYPFLLYIIFANPALIPTSIDIHELPPESKMKKPVNPNIPNTRPVTDDDGNNLMDAEEEQTFALEEIMNPFLDRGGAWFGAAVMAATLITVLALNAASAGGEEHPVFYVTLPGAVVMFCWDMGFGWHRRHQTRDIAQHGREEKEARKKVAAARRKQSMVNAGVLAPAEAGHEEADGNSIPLESVGLEKSSSPAGHQLMSTPTVLVSDEDGLPASSGSEPRENRGLGLQEPASKASEGDKVDTSADSASTSVDNAREVAKPPHAENLEQGHSDLSQNQKDTLSPSREKTSLWSLKNDAHRWAQETFPTPMAVLENLPVALVPFSFCMFVLVQALSTKGWVPVFAHGWDHWVSKTGTVGAIGGMGFLSVVLCNVSTTQHTTQAPARSRT